MENIELGKDLGVFFSPLILRSDYSSSFRILMSSKSFEMATGSVPS